MLRDAIRLLWAEPRAAQPPPRVWRDWVLLAVLLPTAVLEALLRPDVPWRPLAFVLCVVLAFALLWRRTSPLPVVAIAFGSVILVDVMAISSGLGESVGLYTMGYVLLLPYALFRWGSGREVAVGLTIMLTAGSLGVFQEFTTVADAVAAFLVLLFPAALGASARYWATARLRDIDRVRLLERQQLARELHDTVAHHVSAIVIRAQAGRVVGATHPGAAVEALEVIEEEASATLAEMRIMVRALRERDEADLAPQRGVADIERFAQSSGDQPRVEVGMSGHLDELMPSVGSAVYRIAQEAITNALRHARHATRIDVHVSGDLDAVRLTVRDNGDASSIGRATPGYGLAGMTERALLLGGTLEAGPSPDSGWTVNAVLPKAGATR